MSAAPPMELYLPPLEHRSPGFQKGHPRYGGRRKGNKDRFNIDLREAIVAGIAATGFIEKDDQGNPVPTGKRGCQGLSFFRSRWHHQDGGVQPALFLPLANTCSPGDPA
jgi:hypothetical protein